SRSRPPPASWRRPSSRHCMPNRNSARPAHSCSQPALRQKLHASSAATSTPSTGRSSGGRRVMRIGSPGPATAAAADSSRPVADRRRKAWRPPAGVSPVAIVLRQDGHMPDARQDFRLYHSNSLEILAAILARILREPAPGQSLLAPDLVLIPQVAMRRWLQATLAAEHGVAANIEFLTPGEFVSRALDANLPRPPQGDDLDAETLHWHLYA